VLTKELRGTPIEVESAGGNRRLKGHHRMAGESHDPQAAVSEYEQQ